MRSLEGQIALVAGATRGAGRAIACSLGERGATVYCTGRSVRGRPATGTRPETIEETAEMVSARGGRGVAVQVDHTVEAQVEALCAQIKRERGKLDIVVNDVWGGDELTDFGAPFWRLSIPNGRLLLDRAVMSHIITSRHAVPLLLERDRGLIVEITDGDHFGYRGNLFYDLAKMSVIRLAFAMARELRRHPSITALAVTPGFLRSEAMLDLFGVTEENWRDAAAKEPHFIASETPYYVGRAVAALAADPNVAAKAGRVFSSWDLAREYGFTDVDGQQPHWGDYFEGALGPYNRADERAYASWLNGPIDIAEPDWPKE
ncbi:SDR family oxidoreductase [Sorangium sp. So ce1036]|uniref:SDR family oxidoreductase n=1 Tax=Sorangium sp. So ce1036 TaxID=3133328 RepID=UPI003F0A6BBB